MILCLSIAEWSHLASFPAFFHCTRKLGVETGNKASPFTYSRKITAVYLQGALYVVVAGIGSYEEIKCTCKSVYIVFVCGWTT